ncbi:MAG TPA: helix-hairpin-helix domain-containing protein [Albitalea sp.]|nr:helix-hairpin-helix domain-containing protein [Albitalea sp.]
MFKKLLAIMLALFAAAVFAASADVNKASQAELEAVKGIGPGIAGKILDERKKGTFKDWGDLIERVKGVGEANAARFSAEGLTVNGTSFKAAAKSSPVKAASAPAKADAKADKEAKKAAKAASAAEAKKAREDKKAAKTTAAKASEPAAKK